MQAAKAIVEEEDTPCSAAGRYTELLMWQSNVAKEMKRAMTFRQTVAKFGPLFGMPLSTLGNLLPVFRCEPDYEVMTESKYRLKSGHQFDKDTFVAVANTGHREEQPSHLSIIDSDVCRTKCTPRFNLSLIHI